MNLLRWILTNFHTNPKPTNEAKGFTLIELLVAMVIASIVILSLLSFLLGLLNTERREQAKSETEQDLQAALDYMTRDLQQAFFIYDSASLTNNYAATGASGIRNQIPPVASAPGCTSETTCRPVLVFWKRQYIRGREDDGTASPVIGSLETLSGGAASKQDYFRYSLVAYYHIKDNEAPWSSASRIGRFEVRDGIRSPDDIASAPTCSATNTTNCKRSEGGEDIYYLLRPDPGFQGFDLSLAGDLNQRMSRWQKYTNATDAANSNYANSVVTLVDYIDQSTAGVTVPTSCPSITLPDSDSTVVTPSLVPDYSSTGFPNALKTGSFYACVDTTATRTLANVYLRGNALVRIQNGAVYNPQISAFFPETSVKVRGRGLLGTN